MWLAASVVLGVEWCALLLKLADYIMHTAFSQSFSVLCGARCCARSNMCCSDICTFALVQTPLRKNTCRLGTWAIRD